MFASGWLFAAGDLFAVAQLLSNDVEEVVQPERLLDQAVGPGKGGGGLVGRLPGQDQDPHAG